MSDNVIIVTIVCVSLLIAFFTVVGMMWAEKTDYYKIAEAANNAEAKRVQEQTQAIQIACKK